MDLIREIQVVRSIDKGGEYDFTCQFRYPVGNGNEGAGNTGGRGEKAEEGTYIACSDISSI